MDEALLRYCNVKITIFVAFIIVVRLGKIVGKMSEMNLMKLMLMSSPNQSSEFTVSIKSEFVSSTFVVDAF